MFSADPRFYSHQTRLRAERVQPTLVRPLFFVRRPLGRIALLTLAFAPAWVSAQTPDPGQDREVRTRSSEHPSGVSAFAPIPLEMRQRNTGGSDGAGLCVIAAVKTAGEYLGWTSEVRALWEAARQRPGGYYDAKFDALAREVAPNLRYAHYHGADYGVLKRLSQQGIPFGVTMDTGELYNNQPIAHMVAGVHFDDQLTCHVDNNSPGFFTWTSRREWERRSTLNSGEFWLLALAPSERWLETARAGFTRFAVALGVILGAFASTIRRTSS